MSKKRFADVGEVWVCPYCGKKIKILTIKILKEGCRPPQNISENVNIPPENHSQGNRFGEQKWNMEAVKGFLYSIFNFLGSSTKIMDSNGDSDKDVLQ